MSSQVASTPRIDWFRKRIPDGKKTALIGSEDARHWEGKATVFGLMEPLEKIVVSKANGVFDYVMAPEILHKVEYPTIWLENLKRLGNIILVSVPFEYGWDPKWQPFKAPDVKCYYDAETLAVDLEAAGLSYDIELVEFGGWSFLCAEAH